MKHKPLIAYLVILVVLCTGFVIGARLMGEQGAYLVQGYMMTPAIAALITRIFFYRPRFQDANLRIGRGRDYLRFWIFGIGITALSYATYTLLGAVHWDLSGQIFLERLGEQFVATGQDINQTLPSGFTPQMMLWIYLIGGLTVFNIIPGMITGFGEEFGHRGFMFPSLYRIKPWVGFIIGGLIVFAWHLPLMLIIPQSDNPSIYSRLLNITLLAVGTIFAHMYLTYVYVNSKSIFVASFAHIVMNNAAASFSYFVIVQDQLLANLGLTLTMLIVVAIIVSKKLLVFDDTTDKGHWMTAHPDAVHTKKEGAKP
jgi:membrane protease YdiL (CAAX protease family)